MAAAALVAGAQRLAGGGDALADGLAALHLAAQAGGDLPAGGAGRPAARERASGPRPGRRR